MLISTGTTASVPNEREKRVLPVDLRYDVLMAHGASSSISGNSPFAAPSFFFSVFLMILLMASTCPLHFKIVDGLHLPLVYLSCAMT